jgi:hypothetical protein
MYLPSPNLVHAQYKHDYDQRVGGNYKQEWSHARTT